MALMSGPSHLLHVQHLKEHPPPPALLGLHHRGRDQLTCPLLPVRSGSGRGGCGPSASVWLIQNIQMMYQFP